MCRSSEARKTTINNQRLNQGRYAISKNVQPKKRQPHTKQKAAQQGLPKRMRQFKEKTKKCEINHNSKQSY